VKIDDGAEFRNIHFARCEPNGCLIEGEATNDMIQAMARGLNGRIIMMNADQQPRAIPFSLKGFSAAFNEVNASIGN
jgi:invasion protein IalB